MRWGWSAALAGERGDRYPAPASDRSVLSMNGALRRTAALAFFTYVKDHLEGFAVLAYDAPITVSRRGNLSSLLSDVAERAGRVFGVAFKEAGYDAKAAPLYAHALVGMVTFVGRWWTETRSPSVDEVASHLAGLAWMGLRHLPKQPAPIAKRPASS